MSVWSTKDDDVDDDDEEEEEEGDTADDKDKVNGGFADDSPGK